MQSGKRIFARRGNRGMRAACAAVVAVLLAGAVPAGAVPITVTAQNRAGTNGFFVTPLWFAFHNGSFDLFDSGSPLSQTSGFKNLVEDGTTAFIANTFNTRPAKAAGEFEATITSATQGVLPPPANPPVFDPGETASRSVDIDPIAGRFFTYAAMVIPSNDAFIANDSPTAFRIFDDAGNFLGPVTIMVLGAQVRDAGTEVNNELDAAFFNQAANGDGTDSPAGTPVGLHPGLFGSFGNPGGTPIILGHTSTGPNPNPSQFFDALAADFTRPGVEVLRITITPEPTGAMGMLGIGALGGLARRRTRK